MSFTEIEMIEIQKQAWWLHRRNLQDSHSVSLSAKIVTKILGRVPQTSSGYNYTCHSDDRITCGLKELWKTGGKAVIQFCLDSTSEDDLDLSDYVEWFMWESHCKATSKDPRVSRHRPDGYRNGVKLSDEEYDQVIDRVKTRLNLPLDNG